MSTPPSGRSDGPPPDRHPYASSASQPPVDPYGARPPYGQGGAPYGAPGSPGTPGPQVGKPPSDERTIAAIAHGVTLLAMYLSVGWLGFVVPLIMWAVWKDTKPFVRQAAAGAFNFNVTVWIANAIAWILVVTVIGIPVAALLWILVGVVSFVCYVWATVRAIDGRTFRYPLRVPILT